MSTNLDTARARLRAADPTDPVDPHDPSARAMFERIVTDASEPVSVRTRSPRRRLVLAGAMVAVVATAGVVTTPWSHGHPGSAAFAVDQLPDGSINVTVHWQQLRDPAALNAELARLHARTVVIRQSASCQVSFPVDPAHNGVVHVDLTKHPELRKPGALAAWMKVQQPWITYNADGATGAVFTIHPDKVPTDDTLLIPYRFVAIQPTTQPDLATENLLVRQVPPCVPTPEHSVLTGTGVRSR